MSQNIELCAHCKKNPIAIKKSHLCSSCYQKIRRENQNRIPRHASEINFIRNYFKHDNWQYESTTFNLGNGIQYTPDFYDIEEDIFIEVSASYGVHKNNKEKYELFQKIFPYLNFEIRTPNGKLFEGKWKWEKKDNIVRLYISDFPGELQARAKAAAAMTGINLKDWVKVAIQEKLNRETYEDGDYKIDQFGRRCLKRPRGRIMIKINPQPETEPESNVKEFGFTQQVFTSLLISVGLLSPRETIVHWELDQNFLAFDVKEKP